MVLSNGAYTRSNSSVVNQNQGGGNKKAGFSYQIGRSWRSSIALNSCYNNRIRGAGAKASASCCKLTDLQMTFTKSNMSRPIGRNYGVTYWGVPGTGNG